MDLKKSVIQLFLSRAAKSILGFLAVIVFSQEMGASPLGTYYPFLAILGILSIPADLGIRGAVEKRISEGQNQGAYLGTALALTIPIVLSICLLIYSFQEYVNQYLGEKLALLLILGLVVNQMGSLSLAVLRAELRVGETAILEFLRPLCWLVIGYALYLYGYRAIALVYGYLFGSIVVMLLGWWKISIKVGYPRVEQAISLKNYAKFGVISKIGGAIFSWTDIFVLTSFVVVQGTVTRSEVGAYENAWRLSLIAVMLSRTISTAIFPQFSQWDAEGVRNKIENMIPKVALPALLMVLPCFIGTVVLSRDLLRILFGPEFTVAWLALIVLSAGTVVQSLHGIIAQPLQAIDRPDLSAYASAVSIVINIILNIILVWRWGILGAAIATAISFAINTVLHTLYLRRFIQIQLPLQEAAWSIMASVTMGICIQITSSIIGVSDMYELLAIVILGTSIYAAILFMYRPVRIPVRRMLRNIV